MQPQTMTEPPPCFKVGAKHSRWYRSPTLRHTLTRPSLWKRRKRDSSEKTIRSHSSSHFLRFWHHFSLALAFSFFKSGFLQAAQLRSSNSAMYLRTVFWHKGL